MRTTSAPAYLAPLIFSVCIAAAFIITPVSAASALGPTSGGTVAPAQDWWMCSYQDVKDPYKPALGSRMYYTVFPADPASNGPNGLNAHFNKYIQQNYKVHTDVSGAKNFCIRVFNDAASRANSMDMFRRQWASSNIESIRVGWTNTPAEDAAIDAKSASAAAAAAVPTLPADQNYVFCHSAWAAGETMPAGSVMYVSEIFPAVMPPNADSARINRTNALQNAFFSFLEKRYGYKDSSNYPVTCATTFPPTAGGLQAAQDNKRQTEDGVRHQKGQVVETGWKSR